MKSIKIVGISDTHNRHSLITIPECDVLIHAGDESNRGTKEELTDFAVWLNEQPAIVKVFTPGNHSLGIEDNPAASRELLLKYCPDLKILIHESIVIDGIRIFASPYSPYFNDWAYNAGRTITEAAYYRKPFIGDLWQNIPDDTQILITHGPSYDILDELVHLDGSPKGLFVGCVELSRRIKELKDLDLHLFGHIHSNYGQKHIDGVSYYNLSNCDERYYPSNPPTIIEYVK